MFISDVTMGSIYLTQIDPLISLMLDPLGSKKEKIYNLL